METVERALGDLRTDHQHGGGRGGRRNKDTKTGDIKVPATDFDFQSSNARFDKSSMAPLKQNKEKEKNGDDDVEGEGSEDGEVKEETEEPAYNPKRSFFDSLSSGPAQGGGQGGGRGRGRGGRSRREEEREKNVATFGEPGGIGLMGPGAYVGGYGRRGGGGRGRRGGPGPSR